jgi:hypothetical protein
MEKNTILFKTFVGIDISKKTIDVCILDNESQLGASLNEARMKLVPHNQGSSDI